METHLSTCRFCKRTTLFGDWIKYGTRAYACPPCFVKHKGEAGLRELSVHQLHQFPYFVLADAGLGTVIWQIIRDKQAAEALAKWGPEVAP